MCRIKWLALVCGAVTNKPELVWAVLGKVIQSNARFGLSDRLELHLDHVRMPVSNGKRAEKT